MHEGLLCQYPSATAVEASPTSDRQYSSNMEGAAQFTPHKDSPRQSKIVKSMKHAHRYDATGDTPDKVTKH